MKKPVLLNFMNKKKMIKTKSNKLGIKCLYTTVKKLKKV